MLGRGFKLSCNYPARNSISGATTPCLAGEAFRSLRAQGYPVHARPRLHAVKRTLVSFCPLHRNSHPCTTPWFTVVFWAAVTLAVVFLALAVGYQCGHTRPPLFHSGNANSLCPRMHVSVRFWMPVYILICGYGVCECHVN